jgi:hypothetical protein
MEKDKRWRKGFPPHTGWWNASRSKTPESWRWFDADKKQWGEYCNDSFGASEAGQRAANSAYATSDPDKQIKWRSYYPKDARVPRVDPERPQGGHQARSRRPGQRQCQAQGRGGDPVPHEEAEVQGGVMARPYTRDYRDYLIEIGDRVQFDSDGETLEGQGCRARFCGKLSEDSGR